MDEKFKLYQFYAAMMFILIGLGYCFTCVWVKPVIDLSTPIVGISMLLLGYYWGTSSSSKDKDNTIAKQTDLEDEHG